MHSQLLGRVRTRSHRKHASAKVPRARNVARRIAYDDELRRQLQRQERLLAGRELDGLDGDFFEKLLETRFRQPRLVSE